MQPFPDDFFFNGQMWTVVNTYKLKSEYQAGPGRMTHHDR